MTAVGSLFDEINNAVLDIQASQPQSYERPLRKLARLLNDASLDDINRELTEGLDLQTFIDEGRRSGGSFVGSQTLQWPDDQRAYLGLAWQLLQSFGSDPSSALDFGHHFFYSGNKIIAGLHAMVRQLIIPFVRDYKAYVLATHRPRIRPVITQSNRIFIVHGHDGEAREAVARFIERLGFESVILHEQANQGRTIIEKVEANNDVGFAIVLLTPDDEGKTNGDDKLQPRVRQNVLLELGYFMALLGRNRVCALKKGTVDIPSDFAGVVWEAMDSGSGWKQSLGKELAAAGYTIDWNKIMA
jgi:hypothetical protein